MIVRWHDWYRARSLREQRLLLLMAAIAIPVVVWLLVALPLRRAYDAALERHVEAIDRNGRVKMLAALPRSSARPAPQAEGDLSLIIAESAGAAGIKIQSNAADGPNAANIAISSSSTTTLLQWLRELETRGMIVDEMRLIPGPDTNAALTARLVRS